MIMFKPLRTSHHTYETLSFDKYEAGTGGKSRKPKKIKEKSVASPCPAV